MYEVGVIKPNNKNHIEQLRQILKKEGWKYDVVNEFIENLTEGKGDTSATTFYHEVITGILVGGGNDSFVLIFP